MSGDLQVSFLLELILACKIIMLCHVYQYSRISRNIAHRSNSVKRGDVTGNRFKWKLGEKKVT